MNGLPTIFDPNGMFKPRFAEGVSSEEYHADKACVSSSGVRRAVRSAAQFKAYWSGDIVTEETKTMRFGTLAHLAILEPKRFMEGYALVPKFTGYTKKGELTDNPNCLEVQQAKEAWYAKLAPGTVAVTEEEYETLSGMLEAVLQHDDARVALTNGKAELSGWYVDKETGLHCRIRPDFLHFNGKVLVDLKTTRDCEAWSFGKDIYQMGYMTQLAMYCAGAEAITGEKVKFPTLIAIEKEPPYEVAVYVLDDAAMDLGMGMYRRGLRRIKEALISGVWPKYQSRAQNISLPAYAFYDDSLADDFNIKGDL